MASLKKKIKMMKLNPIKYQGRTITFWKNINPAYVYGSYRDKSRKLRGYNSKTKEDVEKYLKKQIRRKK